MDKLDKLTSIPDEIKQMYAEDVKENLANVQDTFFRLSIQGSRYKVEGNVIGDKGIVFDAIVLREIPVNLYYITKYDPANPTSPDCWSLGGLKPDVMTTAPQSSNCASCKQNRFGSAMSFDGKKRSKACSNTRRLVLKIMGVDLPVILNLPPTSIKLFNRFLKELSNKGLPMWAVITEFSFDTTVQYPKPTMQPLALISTKQAHEIKEYRNSAVVENALRAYATNEDFVEAPGVAEEEDTF